ncbi:helix-turn-helix transcriptional regulator [Halorussus caseinilyticus]|uniref:Helix-turn-helix transcriptional regulator n=1 Tax=Halorussus caseinilyticus TaxID=3034025 RepID=A0ABD5WQT7_9EURY|nr:helix-turn-helix transcriptional regulator [Halorussus sp. DT72]
MKEEIELKISGSDPATHARRILDKYAGDSEVETISISVMKEVDDSGSEPIKGDTRDTTRDNTPHNAEDKEEEKKTNTTQKERKKGDIRANTSHHRVLEVLRDITKDDPVSAKEVKKRIKDISESSIYPALTQLWERKLAERERVEDVANPYYKYEISDYGEKKLKELENPNNKVNNYT